MAKKVKAAATPAGKLVRTLQFEKLGKLRRYELRDTPFDGKGKDERQQRHAYEAGFEARARDVSHDTETESPASVNGSPALQKAWRRGYADAKGQEG